MLRRKRAGDLCTPRFAVGHGDLILGLPRRTRFEPILAMHNFRPYTIPLEIKVGFRAAAGPQELTIPYALPARQTEVVSLHPYLQGVIPADVSWASLEISYTSTTRGFAAAMVSVSQDGEHSIRSVLNWVEAGTREGWYWRADREHNTLLGIFNGAETDAVVRVSLDYYAGDTRGSYELPDIAIPARASHLLDIGEVVSSGIPDADGDVIPPGVTFGGYRVRRLGPPVQAGVTTEALIFNHRRKQFLTLYNTGCCQTPASFFPSGNQSGIIGGSLPISITTGDDCTGEPIWDMIAEGYFYFVDSSDSSVANEGSPGWLQFLGVGTTTLTYHDLPPIFGPPIM